MNKNNINQLIVVFDLDDTLIHCHTKQPQRNKESIQQIIVDGNKYWIELRRGMKESLQRLKQKYKIILYTASHANYANEIIKLIEQEDVIFSEVYSRNNCELKNGIFIKNIDLISKNYKRIVCIDDNPSVWNESNNVYICKKYKGGFDDEFVRIEQLLSSCNVNDDVRDVIYEYSFCY